MIIGSKRACCLVRTCTWCNSPCIGLNIEPVFVHSGVLLQHFWADRYFENSDCVLFGQRRPYFFGRWGGVVRCRCKPNTGTAVLDVVPSLFHESIALTTPAAKGCCDHSPGKCTNRPAGAGFIYARVFRATGRQARATSLILMSFFFGLSETVSSGSVVGSEVDIN